MASTTMASSVVYNHCVHAGSTALYLYERVLSIDQEINLVWKRGSKGLFVPALYVIVTVSRVCVIAGDSLVLLETWRNTYGLKKLARGLAIKPSIASLLLRDGTTYFCVLLTVNIVTAVLSAINPILEIAHFCFVFNTILLSRFFLNLREVSSPPELSSISSTFSDLHFTDALHALGGSLAEHMDCPEDVLDHTGESIVDADEEHATSPSS
ncbi:uncharacterized protein B0H18DRAFT_1215027, partial [Fomitopsis serialis]|uniref:uncharacterized protein n=1 Tax=Fomitopsis serialis TaxID=139415 RepID=UPI00200764E8